MRIFIQIVLYGIKIFISLYNIYFYFLTYNFNRLKCVKIFVKFYKHKIMQRDSEKKESRKK